MKIYMPQRTTAQQRPASSSKGHSLKQIIDNRPGAIQQKEMLDGINSVGKVIQCRKFTLSDSQKPGQTIEINTADRQKTSDWLKAQMKQQHYSNIKDFISKVKDSTDPNDKYFEDMTDQLLEEIEYAKFKPIPHVGQGTMTVGHADEFPNGMFTTGAAPCVAMAIQSKEWGVFGVAHFDSDVNHDDGINNPLFASLKGNDETAVSIRKSFMNKCSGFGVYGDVSAIYNSLKSFKTMIVNKITEKNIPFGESFNGFQIILTRGSGWGSNDLYGFYSDVIQQVFPGSTLLPPKTKGGVFAGGGTVRAIDDFGVANIGSWLTEYRGKAKSGAPLDNNEQKQLCDVLTNVLLTLNHTAPQRQENPAGNEFIWGSLERFSNILSISGSELSGEINGLIDKIDAKVDSFKKKLTSDGKRPDLTRKEALTSIHLKFMNDAYRILGRMLNVENPELILKNANIIETVLDIIIGTTQEMQKFESSEKTNEECQNEFNIICNGARKEIGELYLKFKALDVKKVLAPVVTGDVAKFQAVSNLILERINKIENTSNDQFNRDVAKFKLDWQNKWSGLGREEQLSVTRSNDPTIKKYLNEINKLEQSFKTRVGGTTSGKVKKEEKKPLAVKNVKGKVEEKLSNLSVLKKKTTSVYKNTSLSNKKFEPGEKRSRSKEELTKLVDKSNEFKKKPHSVNKSNKKGK